MVPGLKQEFSGDLECRTTMDLFTIEELSEVTGARVLGRHDSGQRPAAIRRLTTDSRDVRRGDLFIALTGERFDGHDFVEQAFQRGAVAALVVSSEAAGRPSDRVSSLLTGPGIAGGRRRSVLGVPDTLRAYQDLSAAYRRRFEIPVVAVTGSNGKTTTKEMVARVLSRRWRVLKTEGNLNNRIGVPRTLLCLTPHHQAAVVEMGVDQRGQTARLCDIVRPTVGVITNIGPDHLEIFGSMDASVQAKAELVDMMPDTGTLVLNADDPYFDELAARAACRVMTFGLSERAQVRAMAVASDQRRGVTFKLMLPERARGIPVELRVHGAHNLHNALAASAVGYVLGLAGAKIAEGLAAFRPAPMRSLVMHRRDGVRLIDDSYNANPASMKAAIDMLAELGARSRTVAVLGDMLELGPEAEAMHREIGGYLVDRGITRLVATGKLGHHIAAGARAAGMDEGAIQEVAEATDAAASTQELVGNGDAVLVKASRGMRMEQVIDALREPSLKRSPMRNRPNIA